MDLSTNTPVAIKRMSRSRIDWYTRNLTRALSLSLPLLLSPPPVACGVSTFAEQIACDDSHDGLVEQLKRELNISLRLEHPNIIRLLDVDIDSTYVHLVQELATGGDLFELIRTAGPLPERRACGIFRQVAAAVQYCHSMSVYHRDLSKHVINLPIG